MWMRISTSKSEAMVLSRKRTDCPLWVVEEFRYFWVLIMSAGKMERESQTDWGGISGDANAILVRCGKERTEPVVVLSIHWSVYVLTLNCGHELWIVTRRKRLCTQDAKMSFLHRVTGLSFSDMVTSDSG